MKSLLVAFALYLPAALAAQGGMPADDAACTAPAGWDEVVARDPDFVVFGELHGTREAPALVQSLICAEAKREQRMLLAVEHSSWQNAAWQEAWALPHDAFRAALPDLGWRGRDDGVASKAMLALVTGAHALKDQGAAIDIVAFNGARDDAQRARFNDLPAQGPHEAAQAENIAEAAALKDYDRVIVLVGNLHAEIAPLSIGGPDFDPMAVRLRSYGSVLSLGMRHAGGENWSCQLAPGTKLAPGQEVTDDMITCAASRAGAEGSSDRAPHITVGNLAEPQLARRFDGTFWLGPISASPPAFPPEK
ncbi:hypothetical protein [Porphyrobacter sp. AAP60]|uniref:hypothetical protein n=1 Tax=Porphyrobacter sp. AAP60 TaxID=1523423 RepID=UPI000AB8831C|nr:hypothetical protein [Porphyrobacter sp. AAP60]